MAYTRERKPENRNCSEGGYTDLVVLAQMAFPQDKDGSVAELKQLYKDYLAAVTPRSREAPVLAAARHALLCSRTSGRPSLGSYACTSFIKTTMPRLIELCHPTSDYPAVVAKYHDNGLFANMLQVFDALLLSREESYVLVDWQRKGAEGHFQYGPQGFDLWCHLFESTGRCRSVSAEQSGEPPAGSRILPSRVSCVFMNMLRGYVWTLPETDLATLRCSYASASKVVVPVARVQTIVGNVCSPWACSTSRTRIIGVHKRLGTPEVAACQLSQRAPQPKEFITKVRSLLAEAPSSTKHYVFLATDDAHAVEAFMEAFPKNDEGHVQLVCRNGVKRTEGGLRADGVDNEVHRSPCEARDAEDALVDAICLSKCTDLVCIDSNLSIFVALTNQDIQLHPLNSMLPHGWEDTANNPIEPVHGAYEVVCNPMVFIRQGPSAASELLGAKKTGEVFRTTGRGFEGWVELEEGGWALTDAERQAVGRGKGMLLQPVELH